MLTLSNRAYAVDTLPRTQQTESVRSLQFKFKDIMDYFLGPSLSNVKSLETSTVSKANWTCFPWQHQKQRKLWSISPDVQDKIEVLVRRFSDVSIEFTKGKPPWASRPPLSAVGHLQLDFTLRGEEFSDTSVPHIRMFVFQNLKRDWNMLTVIESASWKSGCQHPIQWVSMKLTNKDHEAIQQLKDELEQLPHRNY